MRLDPLRDQFVRFLGYHLDAVAGLDRRMHAWCQYDADLDRTQALCEKRKELDVLGVGAYDGDKLVGLAGCSADCEMMYQIGVDVLPEYRRQGIGAAVTSRLAREILDLGKVPFYCAAWSNLRSVGNAIKCGFRPAWVELTARDLEFVDRMNGLCK